MKKRNKSCLFITSILFSMLLFIFPMKCLGSEGAVQTKGEVTLINGKAVSCGSSTLESSLPSSKGANQKPIGRLPSTGELVKKSLAISGIVILLIFLIFYFLRKKEEQSKSKRSSMRDE